MFCENNALTSLDVSRCPIILDLLKEAKRTEEKGVVRYTFKDKYNYDEVFLSVDAGVEIITECENPVEALRAPIDEEHFPDAVFREYVTGFDRNKDGVLTISELMDVELISCSDKKIASLKGVEYFPALVELRCTDNQLTALDVSHNPLLEKLSCYRNEIAALDVSHNPALKELYCGQNQLTALDVSHNPALQRLAFEYNEIAAIDVSRNPALYDLHAYSSALTVLDVSRNPALQSLNCGASQLTSLTLGSQPLLTYLSIEDNQLAEIDLSGCTALKQLYVSDNSLTSLDVSHNPALEDLWCSRNLLTELDVGGNPVLERLLCKGNSLKRLDVSGNHSLNHIECENNDFTVLDVSGTALRGLLMGATIESWSLRPSYGGSYYQYDSAGGSRFFSVDHKVTVLTEPPTLPDAAACMDTEPMKAAAILKACIGLS